MFDTTKRNRPKPFLYWKDCLFFKTLFSTTSFFLKTCSKFHNICQNSLWTLKNCFPRFVTPNNARKNGPKTFVIVKTAIFLYVCFYRGLRSQRKDLVIYTMIVKIPCGPFINYSLKFVLFDNTRIYWPTCFFSLEDQPFFSKHCVFNNLLGELKWSFNFHSNCQNIFSTPATCRKMLVTFDNTREMGQILLSPGR